MKERFNPTASMTYEKRLENLKAKGKAIDKFLRTPQAPKQALTPNGHLKQRGLSHARGQINTQRINITEQVKTLEKKFADKERQKTKIKTRGR